mmetsp:Transcript_79748/g.221964  ORF Transcript_79748/g.221964 Transcript_79748/m.221964 type:complete len:270 (-) Transcript_79748:152-961(-)
MAQLHWGTPTVVSPPKPCLCATFRRLQGLVDFPRLLGFQRHVLHHIDWLRWNVWASTTAHAARQEHEAEREAQKAPHHEPNDTQAAIKLPNGRQREGQEKQHREQRIAAIDGRTVLGVALQKALQGRRGARPRPRDDAAHWHGHHLEHQLARALQRRDDRRRDLVHHEIGVRLDLAEERACQVPERRGGERKRAVRVGWPWPDHRGGDVEHVRHRVSQQEQRALRCVRRIAERIARASWLERNPGRSPLVISSAGHVHIALAVGEVRRR